MQFHPNEIFLLYDPHSKIGKETKATALSFCSHLHEVDIIHEKLSPTYWKEIINILGVHPDQLLNHSHPDYKTRIGDNTYTMDGWLEILVNDAYLITCPIVIFGGHGIQCHAANDISKFQHKQAQKVTAHMRNIHGDGDH